MSFDFAGFHSRVTKNIEAREAKLSHEEYGDMIVVVEANFHDMSKWKVVGDVFVAHLGVFKPDDASLVLKVVQFLSMKYNPVHIEWHACIDSLHAAIFVTMPCVVPADQSKK